MGVTIRRAMAVVVVCATQAACVSLPVLRLYAGDARPRSDVVRIQKDPGLVVVSIDSKPVERFATSNILEVLPGRHVVVTQWRPEAMAYIPGSTIYVAGGSSTVTIEAAAGRAYFLRVQLETGNRWTTAVWDCGTNDGFFKTIRVQCSKLPTVTP